MPIRNRWRDIVIIISGARLIDGTGAGPTEGVDVLVLDGAIADVSPSGTTAPPDGAQRIDASGMTLMPGLIDCHDHLSSFGYGLADKWGLTESSSLRHMRVASVLEKTLATGYTTIRDAGGLEAGFRDAVDEGLVRGPNLQVVLDVITPTGGIGDHASPSGYHHPAPSNPALPDSVADGPDAMRQRVRQMVLAGADAIKTGTTGGASSRPGLGPKDMNMRPEELAALVDEAHSVGKRVMCHALGGPGLRAAIEAGVDSIEHGTHLDEDPDLVHMMVEKNIFYIPTFTVYIYHRERGTPHGRARSEELTQHHIRSLELAMEAGVKIVAGTDAGGWVHCDNAQEISCLVGAGMPPADALAAATSRAAECLGIDGDVGTIETGKRADLVLVDQDPLASISTLEQGGSVRLVMKNGSVAVDRL
ncbi:MAG: amidohydrolase family protein [SAR202 cluster bacterium]|jgi:imidazolonepropionase-like amidohydrolase|nr:amidohydrolase family protein [SAR202 cluster bacterium]MDP7102916.1 amidohydrolase family protein [SAR202 cluster bacterium]MDP7414345.1 amidohydrolase family protein [SAR202 cluster bacterium]